MKRFSLLVAAGFLCSCDPSVQTITIDPTSAALGAKGASVMFKAVARDDKEQPVTDPKVKFAWASSNPAVLSVDETGKVTAVKSGSATITASYKETKGTSQVTVSIPSMIELDPKGAELLGSGQSLAMRATVKDDAGQAMPGAAVAWTSSDNAIATVTGGAITSVGGGTATISAMAPGGITAQAMITVKIPEFAQIAVDPVKGDCTVGATLQLKAAASDAKKTPVAGVPVVWSSSDEKIASVSPAGLVAGLAAGSVKITAKAGDKSATAIVTVRK